MSLHTSAVVRAEEWTDPASDLALDTSCRLVLEGNCDVPFSSYDTLHPE